MAWYTKLKPGEEIVIGGKTSVRVTGDKVADIEINSVGAPPRLSVIKRLVRPDER